MIVTFKDGKTYKAYDGGPAHIVTQLRLDCLVPPPNNVHYMADVAHRLTVWNGSHISYTNEAEFLAELHRLDLITIEKESI